VTTQREHRRNPEAGFGLIEVVVSAAILLIVTFGTLSLIDGAQGTTVKNEGRIAASQLAEQELENLRSVRISELGGDATTGRTGFTRTTTRTVNGVDYKVDSTGVWLRDATGAAPSCTDTGVAEYLRVTTTVTNTSAGSGVSPVTITTLMTPRLGAFGDHTGTLGVQVFRRDGTTPLVGLPVKATSTAQTGTVATNSAGCSLFQYYASGDYTATFTKPGYVDPLGRNPGQVTGKVVDSGLTIATQRYDQSASLRATVQTTSGAASAAYGISVANTGISNASGTRTFPVGSSTSPIDATNLFPVTSGYSVYSGTCTANSPTNYGASAPLVSLNPGDSLKPVIVKQPEMKVTATYKKTNGTTATLGNAVVRLTATDSANCGSTAYATTTDSVTGIAKLGLPYGPYTLYVCAPINGSTRRYETQTVTNDGGTGSSSPAVMLTSSDPSTGSC
jgi:Tfp pilus assembly protein PilV